jgi:hypothetical protein
VNGIDHPNPFVQRFLAPDGRAVIGGRRFRRYRDRQASPKISP